MKITGFQLPFPQLASWIFEPSSVFLKPLTTLRKTRFSELCQNLSSRFWTPRAPVLSWMCFFSWVVVILFDPFYHWCLMMLGGIHGTSHLWSQYLYKIGIPSLKLTVRTWKRMVGRWVSFWDGFHAVLVSGGSCVQPLSKPFWHQMYEKVHQRSSLQYKIVGPDLLLQVGKWCTEVSIWCSWCSSREVLPLLWWSLGRCCHENQKFHHPSDSQTACFFSTGVALVRGFERCFS